jgi:hypothetical protein
MRSPMPSRSARTQPSSAVSILSATSPTRLQN